jgi:hypothetical protein
MAGERSWGVYTCTAMPSFVRRREYGRTGGRTRSGGRALHLKRVSARQARARPRYTSVSQVGGGLGEERAFRTGAPATGGHIRNAHARIPPDRQRTGAITQHAPPKHISAVPIFGNNSNDRSLAQRAADGRAENRREERKRWRHVRARSFLRSSSSPPASASRPPVRSLPLRPPRRTRRRRPPAYTRS